MRSSVIVFPGSNCDRDVQVALRAATGQEPDMVWHAETGMADTDLIVLPGGFSYGDYLRCGAVAANANIMRDVKRRVDAGTPMLAICNGFQIACEIGVLPGVLMNNACQTFLCRGMPLQVATTESPFLGKYAKGDTITIPVAHHDGNYFADADTLDMLEAEDRVAFRYATAAGELTDDANPNGSQRNIAGILSENRRVLGMMPHPERAADAALGGTDGAPMFSAIVEALS